MGRVKSVKAMCFPVLWYNSAERIAKGALTLDSEAEHGWAERLAACTFAQAKQQSESTWGCIYKSL